ncbi:MAG: DHH family phosphoesterase [Selenomonadaceae bacterium]|nr:DHH family phosphoesterase [Selenomonadaceae bacterium]
MPRNLSAVIDAILFLIVTAALAGTIFIYNVFLGLGAGLLWLVMLLFAIDRCKDRDRKIKRYFRDVISNVNNLTNYAIEELPQAILLINSTGRVEWSNRAIFGEAFLGRKVEPGEQIGDFWPELPTAPWGSEGESVFAVGDRWYKAVYRPIVTEGGADCLMAYYVSEVTETERMRRDYAASRAVICYIQVDNADEIFQGLSETERTALLFSINKVLDEWSRYLGCYIRRISDESYVAIMERRELDKAIENKFEVLDNVRLIKGANKIPVTLSIGISCADTDNTANLGVQAQNLLDLALGRGGDQVAVFINGKTQFFGGKAKAVEKHTRVRSRVVAHALRELMEASDEVLIMGHRNEDFDAIGAAMGVAKMAVKLGRPVHIVLSEINSGIDKFVDMAKEKEAFKGILVSERDLPQGIGSNPLLVVVDTHIPHLTAAPSLLTRVSDVVVIDHHRKSENSIEKPTLIYLEPSASSASELVTELLMYFDDSLSLGRYEATALYAGIVVDTKNFAVQTGVRTFEAAAYLRRGGADPVIVRRLFSTDYETNITIAKAKAAAKMYDGGLIITTCPDGGNNSSIIAAQVADSMLRIENVRMSMVLFQIGKDGVGISARSTGNLNVQVIMEEFGGGGHQNVAGAQLKGVDINDIEEKLIMVCKKYIEENG